MLLGRGAFGSHGPAVPRPPLLVIGLVLGLALAIRLAPAAEPVPPKAVADRRWTLHLSQQDFLAATNLILKLRPDAFTSAQRRQMLEVVGRVAWWEDALSDQDAVVWSILRPAQRGPVRAAIRRLRATGRWKAGLPRPAHEYIERFLRVAEQRSGTRRPRVAPLATPDGRPPDMKPLTEIDGQPYEVACVMPGLVRARAVILGQDQWRAFVVELATLRRTEEVLYGEYVALSRIPDERQMRLITGTARRFGPAHIDLYRHVLDLLETLKACP